jgi:type IV pilus assembly protein PilP
MNKLLPCLLIISGLFGCSSDDNLDAFLKDPGVSKGKIPPIPPVVQLKPVPYDGADFPDPCKPRFLVPRQMSGSLQPNMNRAKQALEAFPLESLIMVGILSDAKQNKALIKAGDGIVYKVSVGHYIGQNYGLVKKISKNTIYLTEMIQDGAGAWSERDMTVHLAEATTTNNTKSNAGVR